MWENIFEMILPTCQALASLTAGNFSTIGKQGLTFLVMFYAADCPTCPQTERDIEQAQDNLTYLSSSYKLDCGLSENQAVCTKHKATQFPMLKLFNVRDERKGIVFQSKKNPDSLRQFVAQHHRKPFTHIKGPEQSAQAVARDSGDALFIMTPQPKTNAIAYRLALLLRYKAACVVNTEYSEDAFYKYKGTDLVDYLVKDAKLYIVAKVSERYTVYSGDGTSEDIERWAKKLFKLA